MYTGRVRLCVCLSLAAFPHYCTDPDVTSGNGRTGELRHQSATAPSLATHAADTIAAHQCHERESDVIFTSLIK